MADPETIQNIKSQNEEFERKYSASHPGDDHPDEKKLMHDILAKRLQTVGGKQYYDSADYNKEKQNCISKGLKVPVINAEIAYIGNERSPPNPRLSPKGRRLSSSSGSSLTGSTGTCPGSTGPGTCFDSGLSGTGSGAASQTTSKDGLGQKEQQTNLTPDKKQAGSGHAGHVAAATAPADHQHHIGLHHHHHLQQVHPMHPHYPYHQGSASPTHHYGWHMPHGSQSSSSSHYSGSPLSHFHMSPLHVNTELVKPTRRLSSTSSCGEPSPLVVRGWRIKKIENYKKKFRKKFFLTPFFPSTEGMIQVAFKRPPIPGLDCEAYHGDAIQVSLHSPHSPCTLSNRGRSPSSNHFSSCLSDSNSCRNSPVNLINSSQEDDDHHHNHSRHPSHGHGQHGHVISHFNKNRRDSGGLKIPSIATHNEPTNQPSENQSSINININVPDGEKVPSQSKKPKSSEKDDCLNRTATLTDDCCPDDGEVGGQESNKNGEDMDEEMS